MTHLTPTEIEVLCYVDKGYNKPEIADILNVVVSTIRKHCDNAKAKLHVSSTSMTCSLSAQLELR
jgi:DNA-binding CsgD family transcriptional regulator